MVVDAVEVKKGLFGRIELCGRSFYQLLGNRRKFERHPLSGTIQGRCESYGVVSSYTFSCVDISPRGIGVDCSEPMAPNTVLELHPDGKQESRCARARWCQKHDAVFRNGLEFIAKPGGSPTQEGKSLPR